jgi:hypothetical protein
VHLRLNQTEYKTVHQNITRVKQLASKKKFLASGSLEENKLQVRANLEKHIHGKFDSPSVKKSMEEVKTE